MPCLLVPVLIVRTSIVSDHQPEIKWAVLLADNEGREFPKQVRVCNDYHDNFWWQSYNFRQKFYLYGSER
jgi:hypothetical protein